MSGLSDSPERIFAERLAEIAPAAAAAELADSPAEEGVQFLGQIPSPTAARIIEKMTPVDAERMLECLTPPRAADVLENMDISRAGSLVPRLAAEHRRQIFESMNPQRAKELETLTSYPENTAGRLMDPQVMAFHPTMTVEEVLARLRRLPQKKARELFLVTDEGILCGAVPLQELVVAEPGEKLEELTGRPPATVLGVSSRHEVIEALNQGDTPSVVVVDVDQRLLGIIRRDTLIKAVQEDASLDVQTMVGASREERALSPATFAVRRRLPWLVVNLGTAFLAAAVVGVFESTIARFTALAVLLPVVAGQSGNTGAQALAVTMRGLALREVRIQQGLRVCIKELVAALINGVAIAVVTATAVFIWNGSWGLTLVIGVSMIISMMAAGLSGAAIPLLLTKLKQDPAQSSSIILTTVTDVIGFFSFLGIATLLASQL